MMEAYPLIRNWVSLKIGSGKKIGIREDPWVGSSLGFKLPDILLEEIHERGIYYVWDDLLSEIDGLGRSEWN
jgi:hypothetical protein